MQGGCRLAINRHVFKLLDKKRSLPPGNDATGDRTRIMSLLRINDRRERSYVRLSFCWKRSSCCQVLFIALWSCVVGGEEPRRSEAVVHFTEIRGARQDVVVGIKGIDAQFVANAQFNPRSRHNLHEAKSSLWRDCSVICPALKLHDGANPMLRNRKSRDASPMKAAKDSTRDALGECATGTADLTSARASNGNTVVTWAERHVAARRSRKAAIVLAAVQNNARSRRPRGRSGPSLRATAVANPVGAEEWCCDRSNRGMTV